MTFRLYRTTVSSSFQNRLNLVRFSLREVGEEWEWRLGGEGGVGGVEWRLGGGGWRLGRGKSGEVEVGRGERRVEVGEG